MFRIKNGHGIRAALKSLEEPSDRRDIKLQALNKMTELEMLESYKLAS